MNVPILPRLHEFDAMQRLAGLLPQFARLTAHHDETDEFVTASYTALKAARPMSAAQRNIAGRIALGLSIDGPVG